MKTIAARLTAAISLALLISLAAMLAWQNTENRAAALDQARDFAHSIHEMTLAGLTGMMITGTVGQREVFLDQIQRLDSVRELRVARGEAVSRLFGPGKEAERAIDPVVAEVMRTGQAVDRLESDVGGDYLYIARPALASGNYLGKDCIACHQVPEGTVLGVVSMKVSLDKVGKAIDGQRTQLALASSLLCVAMFVLVYLSIRFLVSRPLAAMSEGLTQIASGEGDLEHRLPAANADEVGLACQAFNRMMDKFAALVRQIGRTAGEVRSATSELAAVAARVAEASGEQRQRSQGVTKAVDDVAAGIASIAAVAEQVREQSHRNLDDSKQGSESLSSLFVSMSEVRKSVEGIVASVSDFVANTRSITDMTRQVKSGSSANAIDQVTRQITAQSEEVMAAIEQGLHRLDRSQDDVTSVASVLETAAHGVQEVNAGVDAIGGATQEQRAASRLASENIVQIAAMAEKNGEAVALLIGASKRLESFADVLTAAVGKFRLAGEKR